MQSEKKKVVAVLSDLMFTVKIQDAAKRAGLESIFVSSQRDTLAQARLHPGLIILDLNHAGMQPLDTIAKLKSNEETSAIELLGFVSHVEGDLIKAAREQGCDTVMARSAFSQTLPALLQRYASK